MAVPRGWTAVLVCRYLSKLIEEACRGEEVIISRGSTPVARLVPVGEVRT
ncbi:MAG: type II toxin-antitoxin system Phd/YefM family antitoxin [Terriglobia bacterium]